MFLACGWNSKAIRRYHLRVAVAMGIYVVLTACATWVVRHRAPHGFWLYFWVALPVAPVISVIASWARYFTEERDEYQRLLMVRSILVGTGALLAVLTLDDFLRSLAQTELFPPFAAFVIFFATVAVASFVQSLQNRTRRDEE